ncbi:MAG: HNH endonuclease [Chloroflexi bacterium]|nr:HNH endonuclease [Chloroflexota bacterium]
MPKIYISVDKQRQVIERARGRCEYCQSRSDYATETFAVDHIVPISRGGTNKIDNLASACSGCNGRKYNKLEAQDPADGERVPLFNPRLQKWADHFSWSADYTHMIGLTPSGRATVEGLQLNRRGLVNMRGALYLIGKHPPKLDE